jgi:hypothetical protein
VILEINAALSVKDKILDTLGARLEIGRRTADVAVGGPELPAG